MTTPPSESSESLKLQGNKHFQAEEYQLALECFNKAIELDPENHILYSNRSGTWLLLECFDDAEKDAKRCIELKPEWVKGYTRLGAALIHNGEAKEALEVYKKGLEIDPTSEMCKKSIAICEEEIKAGNETPATVPSFPSAPPSSSNNPGAAAAPNMMNLQEMANLFGNGGNMGSFLQESMSKFGQMAGNPNLGEGAGDDLFSALNSVMKNPAMMKLATKLAQDPEIKNILGENPADSDQILNSFGNLMKSAGDENGDGNDILQSIYSNVMGKMSDINKPPGNQKMSHNAQAKQNAQNKRNNNKNNQNRNQ